MSPHHEDSPLIRSVKPFKVKRNRLESRSKISKSSEEGGWLGKRSNIQDSLYPKNLDKDLLNLYGSSEGSLETLRESTSKDPVVNLKFAAYKVPRSQSPRLSKLSSLLGEKPHAPSYSQCDTSMRGRQTRASTDSLGPGMPSGSGSSRLTSPVGRSDKDSEMISPETPKSGKRKRQTSQDMNSPKSKNKAARASVLKLKQSDADEIIEVDDTDTPPAKPLRALRSATVLTDYSKVCEFPVGTKDSVSVCLADYKTLQHDTFLNDIIIDLYLTYLYHVFLNKEDRPTVHIFSTMFYKRLNSTPKKASTVASYEKDSSLKPAEKRHLRVKGWTKNVNLFEKNMVIIPICEHSHWYLVIAIRPGLITIPLGSEDRQLKGEPFMIVLDSMGGNKSAAVTNIRHYLAAEWKAKMCGEEGDEEEYEFTSKEMKTVRPQKPEQENYSDCGIYLLHYIEMMFKSVAQYYWPSSIQDLNNWFTIEEISTKRDEIARLIRKLSEDQNLDKEMKFPENIPFLPPAPVKRSEKRRKEFEHSSESEEDDWGKGHVLGGGSSSGLAAAGFYGERSGQTRNLRNGESSSSAVGSGDSDVSSYTASEIAREQRHRNREQRSKEKVASAKLVKNKSSRDTDQSRLALANKLQQIQGARTAFDDLKEYKIPKTVKPKHSESDATDEGQTIRRKSRIPSGESVIVVDTSASSQEKHFTASVLPSVRRSPKKPDKNNSISEPPTVRNSIVNSVQIKSRADLHKEWNCVADLHKIEAEMEEEEDVKAVKKRTKNAALKAFREDQKAIHESIVNEASRTAISSAASTSHKHTNSISLFSKSLPNTSKKKVKSTPEKRKVLQNKVLEDLLELEEEGNTEDEEEEEMTEKVKVLQIKDKPEPVKEIKKVRTPKVKEAFRSIVTEKVKIRDGKEFCKVTPEPESLSLRESTPDVREEQVDSIEYIESPMNSPEITTVEDTPEITTVDYTPEITTVEDTPEITTVDDCSEVTTIDDPAPEEVVSIEDDFPLVGFLEMVSVLPQPESDLDPVVSIPRPEPKRSRKSTSEPSDLVVIRKSTSEPDSPKVKSKSTSEPDSPNVKSKSTSEPDSPQVKRKLTSEPVFPQLKTKSTKEPESPQPLRAIPKPDPPHIKVKPPYVPDIRLNKLKSTLEIEYPEVKSNPEPEFFQTKSTSEPHSPVSLKSTSEPSDLVVLKKQKHKPVPKIQIDSDSDDAGNSSGSDCNFQPKGLETIEVDHVPQRPRRERQFSSLSEIERAKLKNIPTAERKRILADYEKKVQKTTSNDRNQLSKENPFYTSPRGAKSVQQQRCSKARNSTASDASESEFSFQAGCIGQDSIQIDYKSTSKVAITSKKKFKLQNHGKLSPHSSGKVVSPTLKISNVRSTNNFHNLTDERFASDSGSDCTDLYNTEDL